MKKVDDSLLLSLYKKMLLLRRAEEAIGKLYTMQKINGFCHLYIGQEAVAVGLCSVKNEKDVVITSYRCHGLLLALGVEPKFIIAELMGKVGGISKGRGGSMHMFCPDKGFYGGHGIVGSQVSLGTGMAFAHKYKGDNALCYCLFGDGALNQGQVYESFNMAALWGLPVVYIVENNVYAMGTRMERASVNSHELYKRGESFGIKGVVVDGMDVWAFREAVKEASVECQHTQRPMLIEARTYRYKGHSMSDPALYRAKEELSQYKEKDPINVLEKHIVERLGGQSVVDDIEDDISAVINEAIAWSEQSEFPISEDLGNFIYSPSF
ncbi:pyruvate dehydrogenase (acetyl-transferring) E1 component subunit alpha [Candidatus Xenohaliotis californiensis]